MYKIQYSFSLNAITTMWFYWLPVTPTSRFDGDRLCLTLYCRFNGLKSKIRFISTFLRYAICIFRCSIWNKKSCHNSVLVQIRKMRLVKDLSIVLKCCASQMGFPVREFLRKYWKIPICVCAWQSFWLIMCIQPPQCNLNRSTLIQNVVTQNLSIVC